jgi:hypothetical protein
VIPKPRQNTTTQTIVPIAVKARIKINLDKVHVKNVLVGVIQRLVQDKH